MKELTNLKKTILLYGESGSKNFDRTFTIVKKLSESAHSVCYEAYHESSGRGVLKQLCSESGESLEAYRMLLDAKQNGNNQDLATFIPTFEIYRGAAEADGNGPVYVWMPEPKLETFDKVCEEIHRHPERNTEHKLVTVLSAIETLTKCVCALHSADMLHRDIKPSNFGFVKRGDETLTQAISLFDIDTVCSVYDKTDGAVGTPGYMEPEAGYACATNQTDIYAIGATLFYAIIITDETAVQGYLYRQEYYSELREMVDASALIRTSESNSHPRLRNALVTVLQKCLCERTYRYPNCEELLTDLETALYYALPSEIARKSRNGQRWVLADAGKSLDSISEKNSSLAIKYHLYENPLYLAVPATEQAINVLVIGFGSYGQKFLDACLQVGQLRNKELNITVISDDAADSQLYLAERPELGDFFRIDAVVPQADSYGSITFRTVRLERDNPKKNEEKLLEIMYEQYEAHCPDYIFIALGEDSLNRSAARTCQTAVEEDLKVSCTISYVSEGTGRAAVKGCLPVRVNADITQSALHAEIERMAFNTHLIWAQDYNLDDKTLKADYRDKYNHDSCVSSVLSLKYRLYSVGIDLRELTFEEAAAKFESMLANKKNRAIQDELLWMEHRRWVTEKLCLGWRRLRSMEECEAGATKNERRKRHICIVPSRPDQKLAREYARNGSYEKWDTASEQELAELDELDRMSVNLHRSYVRKAADIRQQNLLAGGTITSIRTLIENDRRATLAFQEWYACLKDIWNGEHDRAHLYYGLKDAFLKAAEALEGGLRDAVCEQVKAFEAVFYPILASMEYRDWKQVDAAFTEQIPFILTYTEDACMVIPYATGDNTAVFDNVAAAAVVNPAKILYLYWADRQEDVDALRENFPYVVQFMNKKRMKAVVDLVLAYPVSDSFAVNARTDTALMDIGGGRLARVKHMPVAQMNKLPRMLSSYLAGRSRRKDFFVVEENQTRLSCLLQGAGVYEGFAHYRFCSAMMTFDRMAGCDMLRYIKRKPYISVSDMTAFSLSAGDNSGQPEFFADYKELWHKYSEDSHGWKSLCMTLGSHAQEVDVLAVFSKRTQQNQNTSAYSYLLPFTCSRSASKIIDFLKKEIILEPASHVSGCTTHSCEVTIVERRGCRAQLDQLFARVYALMDADAIELHLNTKSHEVTVSFDNLVVSGVKLSDRQLELLCFFRDKGYVIHVERSADGVSFTYATRQIKELMTTAGKMLEVYTYHKARELGKFDDVVSGYEVSWKGTEVKSEFDCILTKGYRSLFVECKARADIEQEFYYKLAGLAQQFGINATAVLIADTQEKSSCDHAPVNAMQRKRGNMMDVVTIWKPEEISNIGHTLLKVINGTYENQE